MTLAYCTFLELTKFGGRKPSPESVGWFFWLAAAWVRVRRLEGLCMGLLQVQTHRRKDAATSSCHLAKDVEGFHPTVKRLGKLETPRDSRSFLRNPRAFKRDEHIHIEIYPEK